MRRPKQSLSAPEKTLEIERGGLGDALDQPTRSALAPSVADEEQRQHAWTISDETSISRLTKPSTQTPRGTALCLAPGVGSRATQAR